VDRPSSLSSAVAVATVPARDAPRNRLTRSPPASSGARAGNGPAVSAQLTRSATEDHDRITQDQNDVVASRLFAAGLDLQAALGLIGDQHVADHIGDAIGNLDQAIRDLRDTIFHRGACDS
jgi:signal transduction histidine kinase